jgi:hypothetical protein
VGDVNKIKIGKMPIRKDIEVIPGQEYSNLKIGVPVKMSSVLTTNIGGPFKGKPLKSWCRLCKTEEYITWKQWNSGGGLKGHECND